MLINDTGVTALCQQVIVFFEKFLGELLPFAVSLLQVYEVI
jgi:hypothetical protein